LCAVQNASIQFFGRQTRDETFVSFVALVCFFWFFLGKHLARKSRNQNLEQKETKGTKRIKNSKIYNPAKVALGQGARVAAGSRRFPN
jgi:hypothetical protein